MVRSCSSSNDNVMPQRYLVVAPQGLGDSLEATPLVASLRTNFPDCRLDVVVTRDGPAQLFCGLQGVVDEVIFLPYWDRGPVPFLRKLAGGLRRAPYDASFLAFPSARPVYRVLLSAFRARQRFAHDWNFGLIDRLTRTRAVHVRDVHNVERNRDLLRAAAIPVTPLESYLTPPKWSKDATRNPRRIVVHVGSVKHDGLDKKRWPVVRFAELCRELAIAGYEVTLLCGPDELDETRLCSQAAGGILIHQSDLAGAAHLLASSGALVASDNGVAHLAAGVGTPVVAIFGPTPLNFAPFAANAIALRPSSCPPCFDVRRPQVTCVRNIDFACLKDVTVEMVFEAIQRCIERKIDITANPRA